MSRILAEMSLAAVASIGAWGQDGPARPSFEVASVKPNKTDVRGGSMDFSQSGERFTMTNMPVGALILVAYDLTVRQLSGATTRLSDRFDIAAKAEQPATGAQMRQMLQSLLADRFQLQIHWETRETPVYALTVARGGPKSRPSSSPDDRVEPFRIPARAGGEEGPNRVTYRSESMRDFAWALSRMAGIGDRVVVDETGLEGAYDFTLEFVRERAPSPSPDFPASPEGPPLFAALQEQLGLKLEAKRGRVAFLVIDRLDPPSGN